MAVVGVMAVAEVGSAVMGSDAARHAANTQADSAAAANAQQQAQFNTQQANQNAALALNTTNINTALGQNETNLTNASNALNPWASQGGQAVTAMNQFMGLGTGTGIGGTGTAQGVSQFQYNPANDPLNQFMQSQGSQAIANQSSALGGVNSGKTLQSLSDYGQNTALASYQTEFNNWNTNLNNIYSRLSGVSAQGQNAVLNQNSIAQYQTGLSQNAAQNLAGLGANNASNIANQGLNTATSIGSNLIGAGNAQAAGIVSSANQYQGALTSMAGNPQIQNWLAGIGTNNQTTPAYTPTDVQNLTPQQSPYVVGYQPSTGYAPSQ
jgi:hypothetical protein